MATPAFRINEFSSKGEVLGRGAYAYVCKGYLTADPTQEIAIKVIDLDRLIKSPGYDKKNLEHLQNEISIQKMIQHNHVVRLFEVYRKENMLYLTMELLKGGDLSAVLQHLPQKHVSEPI